jgi:hypothetical protein
VGGLIQLGSRLRISFCLISSFFFSSPSSALLHLFF